MTMKPACIPALIALGLLSGCSRQAPVADTAPTVLVSVPLHQQVTEWDD